MQRAGGLTKYRPRGISLAQEPKWRRANLLPSPPCPITLRDTHPSRLSDHYHTTLKEDLMYMTYVHDFETTSHQKKERTIRLKYDIENPYTKNRPNPPVGGATHTGIIRKPLPPSSPTNVIELKSIHLHTFVKESITNRSNLLPAIMALRNLSGCTKAGGGHHTASGVEIIKGKNTEGGWIRPGIPCGAKVELKGELMYTFLSTLVTFVLPRMKDFQGFTLPSSSTTPYSPSSVSGVVSIGLPPNAMALFPQIEVNVDSYGRLYGFHIHFVTNARGVGAQMRARQLLSGFQIPFARR